jgi:uncharacterized protein
MTIGILRIELAIPEARSLKEKRGAIKSIKEKMIHKFHVSAAEVDELDSWKRAVLGVALVANDARFVHSCLDKIVDWVRTQRAVTLIDYDKETH